MGGRRGDIPCGFMLWETWIRAGIVCHVTPMPAISTHRDTDGKTPLHFAAAKGSLKSVQLITDSSPGCINDEDNTEQVKVA